MQRKLTLLQSLIWIFSSILLISGPCFGGFYLYRKFHLIRKNHPEYRLKSIITPNKIHPDFFCEVLHLDKTKKVSLYSFDIERAKEAFLCHPVIKDVFIQRHPPSSLYIDCEFRNPIGVLLDFENTLIDEEGYVFPFKPFYKKNHLPEIYLGVKEFGKEVQYSQPINSIKWQFALEIMRILHAEPFKKNYQIDRVDVSNLEAKSYGRKEIVLMLKEKKLFESIGKKIDCTFPLTLRFHPKTYQQQLRNFLALREEIKKDYQKQLYTMELAERELTFDRKVFDFRIPKLAFIDP